ncbi:DNA mismatch repair protein spellchecker 1 [Gryllus bimaculatus]|nr:DNA mismatch repair protein spellchecker 1 [Gryllus bimaculatus]
MMSNVVIFKLLVDIRDHIGCLYKLCENIAYLDMLVSFARASALPNFVMPKFGDTLDVKGSHHPILEFINPSEPVANDIFSSVHSNVHIITGPNMSGKSIYIRQVVLLQIMAQIGCYVPAVDATFRISDRIFTRIGFDDSIECNASTFVLEIREVQYILQTMTPSSLIIMDELCRGTSSEEGTAVAWTLCESLLQSDAFIFLTTHFMLLTNLESIYTNVKNYHFEILEQEDNPNQFFYSHRLLPGPSQSNNYGIHLAEILGMPESIAKQARELSGNIFSQEQPTIETNGNINDDRLYLELHCELLKILKQGPLSKKACLDLKYRLFPSVTTSDELIEIGEIIPCSSNREDLPITPATSQKNIPIDDMTAQDILPSLLCNTLRKENVEVTKGESCKNFVDNEYNFSHVSFQCGNMERDAGGTLRNIGENIEELNADNDYNFSKGFQYDNTEGTENSFREENIEEMNEGSNSDNEYNFTNAGFEFDNVKDLEAHIESNDFFQFPLEDRSDSNERTILDVLNDLTEEN